MKRTELLCLIIAFFVVCISLCVNTIDVSAEEIELDSRREQLETNSMPAGKIEVIPQIDMLINCEANLRPLVVPDKTFDMLRTPKEELVFSSSDERIAIVDSLGKITAIGGGEAIISIDDKNYGHAECTVRVQDRDPIYSAVIFSHSDIYFYNSAKFLAEDILPHTQYSSRISWIKDYTHESFIDMFNIMESWNKDLQLTQYDVTFIYMATHGITIGLFEDIGDGFATMSGGNISYTEMKEELQRINGQLVVFFDTCYSGNMLEAGQGKGIDLDQAWDNYIKSNLETNSIIDHSMIYQSPKPFGLYNAYLASTVYYGPSLTSGQNRIHLLVATEKDVIGGALINKDDPTFGVTFFTLALWNNYDDEKGDYSAYRTDLIEHGRRLTLSDVYEYATRNIESTAFKEKVGFDYGTKILVYPENSDFLIFQFDGEEKTQNDDIGDDKNPIYTVGNSASNIVNGGFLVEGEGSVFFADGKALWMIDESTNHATKLVDGSFGSLNYWDGYIYAVKNDYKAGTIYTGYWNTRCVYDSESYDDDELYEDTVREGCIVRIGLDGSINMITEPLLEDVAGVREYSNMVIVDGQIYYIGSNAHGGSFYESWYDWEADIEYDRAEYRYKRGNSIYRMNLDGTNKTEIVSDAGNFGSTFTTDGNNLVVIRGYDNFSADGITDYIVTDMAGSHEAQFSDPFAITDWLPLLHNGEVLSLAYGGSGDDFPAIIKYSLDGKDIKQMNLNTANCSPVIFKDALYYYTCLNIDALYYGGNITANDFALMCADVDGSSNELVYTGPELSQSGYDELWCINAKLSASSNYIYLEELEYDSGRQMCKRLYRLDTYSRVLERVELGDRQSNADSTLVIKSYTGYIDVEFERHDHSIDDNEKSLMAYYDLPVISGNGDAVKEINSALREDYDEYVSEIDQILTDEYTHWEWTTREDPFAYYIDVTQGIYLWDDDYEIEGGVQYDRNNIVSLAACGYWMMGGVNGMPLYTYTFDTQTGRSLSLHDLFSNWNDETLLSTFKESICTALGDYVDTNSDGFQNLQLKDMVFFISENGEIILCLENYQLGAATSIGPIISTGVFLGDDRQGKLESNLRMGYDTLYMMSGTVDANAQSIAEQYGVSFPLSLSIGGAWEESIRIKSDWSFSGEYYYDGEDGEWGEFSGNFGNIRLVDDCVISMDVVSVNRDYMCLLAGDACLLYLPGVESSRLPESQGLDPYDDIYYDMEDVSDIYVLHDVTSGYILSWYAQ